MVSQSKKLDKEIQLEMAEIITISHRIASKESLDLLEYMAEGYEQLEEKIATHDYSKEDEILDRLDSLLKPVFDKK